ncbi:response regulator [Desulfobacterales bacterium HSG17]|nr:response regulator [Desulfobacterales bacterium HSG17]
MAEKTHTVLCVDSEKPILSSLKRLFRKESFNLLTASSCQKGLDILKKSDVHLIISDQRMPEMSGIKFLSKVKEKYTDTIRIVLTGYTEVDTIRDAINDGHIYKFILKPWNDDNIKNEIKKSLEQYDLIQANRSLNKIITQKNLELGEINKNLEKKISIRTRELELRNQALELSRALFEGLPAPVIGLNIDKTIVLINQHAQKLAIGNQKLIVGKSILEYFSSDIEKIIEPVFKSEKNNIRITQKINKLNYMVEFCTMPGRFFGKGVILYFNAIN